MHRTRERHRPSPEDLSPRHIGLTSYLARTAAVYAEQFIAPEPGSKPLEEGVVYLNKIVGNIARHRLDPAALPEADGDVARLPTLHGIAPPRADVDFPTQIGLIVARTGFEIGKPQPGVPPHEIEKSIIRDCMTANAFHLARSIGIDDDSVYHLTAYVKQSIGEALNEPNPVTALNTMKAQFTGPEPEAEEITAPWALQSPATTAMADIAVASFMLTRFVVGEGRSLAIDMCDEAISASMDDSAAAGHERRGRLRRMSHRHGSPVS